MCTETDTRVHVLEHKAPACQDDGSKDEVDKTKDDMSKHRVRLEYIGALKKQKGKRTLSRER